MAKIKELMNLSVDELVSMSKTERATNPALSEAAAKLAVAKLKLEITKEREARNRVYQDAEGNVVNRDTVTAAYPLTLEETDENQLALFDFSDVQTDAVHKELAAYKSAWSN